MSSERFVETLKQLRYPKAQSLDPQGFDWIFENTALTPFLDWFCDGVNEYNLLQQREIREFQALQEAEDGILDGQQLEDALQNMSLQDDNEISEDQLKEDIAQMEADLQQHQKRKEKVIHQRNKLSMHHSTLNHRLSKMNHLETSAQQLYRQGLQETQDDNTKMNTALVNLRSSVSSLSALYGQSTNSSPANPHSEEQAAIFLSQMPLQAYHQMEEKFTQELTAYTKKQFFEGIGKIAGQDDGSRYEFLEISNPQGLVIKGETEEVTVNDCKELQRLQMIYPKSESQRMTSLVEAHKLNACLRYAQEKFTLLRTRPYPIDIQQLGHMIRDAKSTLETLNTELAKLEEDLVPTLIDESAGQQFSHILRGDYDLKIARQDYFTTNQDQVINQLVLQRARNEFLTMIYEVEARNHRDTHRLLLAVSMQLQTNLKAIQDRMKMLSNPCLAVSSQQRETIDSRDKSMTRLHNILVDKDPLDQGHQLFLTYPSLKMGADKLHNAWTSIQASLSSANNNQDRKLQSLEKNIKACEAMVYTGSSTREPVLSPQPIIEGISQLGSMLKKLEQSVLDIRRDVEDKKKLLKSDRLHIKERSIFTNFFVNPEELYHTQEELNARVQAQLSN